MSDYRSLAIGVPPCVLGKSAVMTLQSSSAVFWDCVSLHMGNAILRIYQTVLSFILNTLTQSFKKIQQVYAKNNHSLS